jgi:hypothetical protein
VRPVGQFQHGTAAGGHLVQLERGDLRGFRADERHHDALDRQDRDVGVQRAAQATAAWYAAAPSGRSATAVRNSVSCWIAGTPISDVTLSRPDSRLSQSAAGGPI